MHLTKYKAEAIWLDASDPIQECRDLFVNNDVIYLDGNSLGKLPKKSIALSKEIIEQQWGHRMIRSWNERWVDMPNRIAAKIANLIGADADEVFIGDTTSINLYKLAFAVLTYQNNKNQIITDDLNFPSDLYILQGLVKNHFKYHSIQTINSHDEISIDETELISSINDKTSLITLSHVLYKSAFMYNTKKINDAAFEKNALVLWDLSHATGAVPLDMHANNTQLAVGCTYKYLNGGPGAPAFLYVSKALQSKLINPISAWFSHQKPFDFSSDYIPSDSIQKFATSTPGILSLAPVEVGIDIFLECGMDKIRIKSMAQSEWLISMIQDHLTIHDFIIASPLDANLRGSHISIQHKEGYRICKCLIDPTDKNQVAIIPDFRPPYNIRLGIAPLYNTFTQLYQTVVRLKEIMESKDYERFDREIVGVS